MHTMHLLPSVAIQPNLELKTLFKQLLGSLPLVIELPLTELTRQTRRAVHAIEQSIFNLGHAHMNLNIKRGFLTINIIIPHAD